MQSPIATSLLLSLSYPTYHVELASSPGHSQILACSRGEKSGEGLGSSLRHGPEMVDSVSTNEKIPGSPCFSVLQVTESWAAHGYEASSLPYFGNKPKKFNLAHQAVSRWRCTWFRHKTVCYISPVTYLDRRVCI